MLFVIFYNEIIIVPMKSATELWHVQAHTGAQHFATVSGLNDMFPGNGAQRCVKNVSPISSKVYINHAVLKRPLSQWVQVK